MKTFLTIAFALVTLQVTIGQNQTDKQQACNRCNTDNANCRSTARGEASRVEECAMTFNHCRASNGCGDSPVLFGG